MSDYPLPAGKLPAPLLRALLADAPPPPPELRLPPRIGEDAGVIAVEGGALIVASDPVTLTGRGVAAHAALVNANDIAVMGARPRWFLATVLLPLGTREAEVRALFADLHAALARIGAVRVGGHTEITRAVVQPVVVGQMLGLRADGGFVRTGGVGVGDVVLQIGPAPVEGAAVLAVEAAGRLENVPVDVLDQARAAIDDPGISVVGPALRAAALGASAMHDPTEGGLSTGLYELAEASGVALRIDRDAVRWFAPGVAVCAALGADPWGVLASGTLLAAFAPEAAAAAREALVGEGHVVATIAVAEPGSGVGDAAGVALPRFDSDEVARILAD